MIVRLGDVTYSNATPVAPGTLQTIGRGLEFGAWAWFGFTAAVLLWFARQWGAGRASVGPGGVVNVKRAPRRRRRK